MKVTQIVELSKSRSKVYIDQEFAFVLYKGELRLYHIREGEEIGEEDYRTIIEDVLPKRAKLRAMNLLQKREYTTAQLHAKLKQGFYPEEAIAEAIAYVASYHYTDDLRYAVSYIIYHENDRSRLRIEQDLQAKGIDKETIARAWEQWKADGGTRDEEAMIRRLLEKRNYFEKTADYKEWNKTYAFLLRKGFPADKIRRVMGENIQDIVEDIVSYT